MYMPSLEALVPPEQSLTYLPDYGPVGTCRIPIDVWRQIDVGLTITAPDGKSSRTLTITVNRTGCPEGVYFHNGICRRFCPTKWYAQEFNNRCGACNSNCQVCESWWKCRSCVPNTPLESYKITLPQDGTCTGMRIHKYAIFRTLTFYFSGACVILLVIYAIVGIFMMCRPAAKQKAVTRRLLGEEEERGAATRMASRGVRHADDVPHLLRDQGQYYPSPREEARLEAQRDSYAEPRYE